MRRGRGGAGTPVHDDVARYDLEDGAGSPRRGRQGELHQRGARLAVHQRVKDASLMGEAPLLRVIIDIIDIYYINIYGCIQLVPVSA